MKQNEKKSTAKILVLAKDSDALSGLLTMLAVLAKMSRGGIVYQVVENDEAIKKVNSPEVDSLDADSLDAGVSDAGVLDVGTSDDFVPMDGLPAALDFSEMKEMLEKLVDEGVLGDGYQLKGQSWTQRSVIVAYLSGRLGRKCMWSAFAQLWHCDKCGLKSAYIKHCDTEAAKKYYMKLDEMLG